MQFYLSAIFVAFFMLVTPLSAIASPISFETEDGMSISGDIQFPETISSMWPAVIFIHQGGSDKSEWIQIDLYKDILEHGMVAFAYDVRGHGQSEGELRRSLFDDPERAPKDLEAALDFLATQDNIDMTRIAIVGSSIGANLALVGLSKPEFEVKTAVAISGKTSAWINLAGGSDKMVAPSSAYLIAAENEQGGLRAVWAKEMYEASSEPRQLDIVPESKLHGTHIVENSPELQSRILDWLKKHL